MGYVEANLIPGEKVVYRAHLHPIVFLGSALLAASGLFIRLNGDSDTKGLGTVLLVGGLAGLGMAWLRFTTSEFAVTSGRVIIKTGWLSRTSVALQLAKVETLAVEQSLLGGLFDYGTLMVGGTGGTKEKFTFVASPLRFRNTIQQQADAASAVSSGAQKASVPGLPMNEERRERECPHCAERILAKATMCRYCGQTVNPLA